MGPDSEKIVAELNNECRKNISSGRTFYTRSFKHNIYKLAQAGFSPVDIVQMVPISITSAKKWSVDPNHRDIKKKKNLFVPVSVSSVSVNSNSKKLARNPLGKIRTILLGQVVLQVLLIILFLFHR